jgi:hypothetical protein
MSISPFSRFLRPCLQRIPHIISASEGAAYLQFYSAARKFSRCKSFNGSEKLPLGLDSHAENEMEGHCKPTAIKGNDNVQKPDTLPIEGRRDDVTRRVNELEAARALNYPRIKLDERAVTCGVFRDRYSFLKAGESLEGEYHTIRGRLHIIVLMATPNNDRKDLFFSDSRVKIGFH